jgi:hypothetical protein
VEPHINERGTDKPICARTGEPHLTQHDGYVFHLRVAVVSSSLGAFVNGARDRR